MTKEDQIELEVEKHIQKIESDFKGSLTFGARVADKVATFGGSWTFIFWMLGTLSIWVLFNSLPFLENYSFDVFPYILLNLALSLLASLQAPVIMLSNNRQNVRDRFYQDLDFRHNFVAAQEVSEVHVHVEEIMEAVKEIKEMYDEMTTMYSELSEITTLIKDIHKYITENGWNTK